MSRPFNGGDNSSTNSCGKTGYLYAKECSWAVPYLASYAKKLKHTNINIKVKVIKLSEEEMWVYIYDFGFGKGLLAIVPKAWTTKI